MTAEATRGLYANSFDALATIARADGVRGLWRASGVNMLRASVASGAQLTAYDAAKAAAAAAAGGDASGGGPAALLLRWVAADRLAGGAVAAMVCSCVAAVAYTSASAPVDLVKSKLMAVKGFAPPGAAGTTAAGVVLSVVRAEGPKGLWRGWGVSTMRLLPVVVLVFPAMEHLRLVLGVGAF